MTDRHYIVDVTIPGLAEVEVKRIAWQQEQSVRGPRGLSQRQLRDLGINRDAA